MHGCRLVAQIDIRNAGTASCRSEVRLVEDTNGDGYADTATLSGFDVDFDSDEAAPGGLWDPQVGAVAGGVNQADVPDAAGAASTEPQPPEAADGEV